MAQDIWMCKQFKGISGHTRASRSQRSYNVQKRDGEYTCKWLYAAIENNLLIKRSTGCSRARLCSFFWKHEKMLPHAVDAVGWGSSVGRKCISKDRCFHWFVSQNLLFAGSGTLFTMKSCHNLPTRPSKSSPISVARPSGGAYAVKTLICRVHETASPLGEA